MNRIINDGGRIDYVTDKIEEAIDTLGAKVVSDPLMALAKEIAVIKVRADRACRQILLLSPHWRSHWHADRRSTENHLTAAAGRFLRAAVLYRADN
ncbi:hypothetical protein IAE50_20880 [Kosakonia sp. S42]|nr:hypothetical protein [Kosakonia sp. S42]MBK0018879.1 hypothetical protein [Kosakonia sp. S42]